MADSACGEPAVTDPDSGMTVNPQNVTFCDVKAVLDANCASCHGATPVSGAPQLMTRAQLIANSPAGGTMLDRSIYLMGFTPLSGAMPPNVGSSAADIAVLEAWKKNGLPNCTLPPSDAGVDAGTMTPVCTSGRTWNFGTSGRTEMNPGEACVSCHTSRGRGPLDGFMGTVYPTVHELPLCMDTSVPGGLVVEILD
ncbi:MAG: hypothetical protein U0228_31355, partial [Myxococcaceae bacterium]